MSMRISMQQVQSRPAVREQAARTLGAGIPVTITAQSSDVSTFEDPFKNVLGGVHVLSPGTYNFQNGLYRERGQSALVRSFKENPALWDFALERVVDVADAARDTAKEAAVSALSACHPTCASAISAAFNIFGVIQTVALLKIEDMTVAALVIDGMRNRFVLHPHLKNDTVEVGIHPQKA
jgi:hypothetical protein